MHLNSDVWHEYILGINSFTATSDLKSAWCLRNRVIFQVKSSGVRSLEFASMFHTRTLQQLLLLKFNINIFMWLTLCSLQPLPPGHLTAEILTRYKAYTCMNVIRSSERCSTCGTYLHFCSPHSNTAQESDYREFVKTSVSLPVVSFLKEPTGRSVLSAEFRKKTRSAILFQTSMLDVSSLMYSGRWTFEATLALHMMQLSECIISGVRRRCASCSSSSFIFFHFQLFSKPPTLWLLKLHVLGSLFRCFYF